MVQLQVASWVLGAASGVSWVLGAASGASWVLGAAFGCVWWVVWYHGCVLIRDWRSGVLCVWCTGRSECKPEFLLMIQHTTLSTHSITVSLPGFRFAGVYYPPFFMSEQSLQTNLNQIGSLDLLPGDINTKFQHNPPLARRGPACNPSPRVPLFQTWAVNTNMSHIQDPSEYATSHTIPDHVFAAIQHQPNIALSLVSTQGLIFQTDYRFLLHVKFHPPASSSRPSAPQVPRASTTQTGPTLFHVQRLRKEPIAKKSQQNWDFMETLFTSFKGSARFDVNMLDSILCAAVQAIAESILGIYTNHRSQEERRTRLLNNSQPSWTCLLVFRSWSVLNGLPWYANKLSAQLGSQLQWKNVLSTIPRCSILQHLLPFQGLDPPDTLLTTWVSHLLSLLLSLLLLKDFSSSVHWALSWINLSRLWTSCSHID